MRTDDVPVRARASAIRSAGGPTRIGVVAYEGDWAAGEDRLLVNDKPQADSNFFVSAADGASAPERPERT
ncbi:hypothetical protein [Lentzea roselyniae]|uniref:hypothetical protein n=1 Tax=Lentzea roselyniae TaxID=531940 RepID=UPI0031F8AB1B